MFSKRLFLVWLLAAALLAVPMHQTKHTLGHAIWDYALHDHSHIPAAQVDHQRFHTHHHHHEPIPSQPQHTATLSALSHPNPFCCEQLLAGRSGRDDPAVWRSVCNMQSEQYPILSAAVPALSAPSSVRRHAIFINRLVQPTLNVVVLS